MLQISYQTCFANIFSLSMGCICILMIVSFVTLFFKILIKSSVSIFPFVLYGFGVISKNLLQNSRSWRFAFVFSFKSLSFYPLFNLLIHFYLFLHIMGDKDPIHYLAYDHPVILEPLLQHCSFPLNDLHILVESQLSIDKWFCFWSLYLFAFLFHFWCKYLSTVLPICLVNLCITF